MGSLSRLAAVVLLASLISPDEFVALAQDYQWTDAVFGCLDGSQRFYTLYSIESCQQRCIDQDEIVCLSINYNNVLRRCAIAPFNKANSDPVNFHKPCNLFPSSTWQYSEWSVKAMVEGGEGGDEGGDEGEGEEGEGGGDGGEGGEGGGEEAGEGGKGNEGGDEGGDEEGREGGDEEGREGGDEGGEGGDEGGDEGGEGGGEGEEDRKHKKYWTDTVLGCIKRHNAWVGVASSLEDCQKRCVEATRFACLSIEFLESTKSCGLSRVNRNTVSPTNKFKQPCHKANWKYAERVDVGQWTPQEYACIQNDIIRSVSGRDLASCKLVCSQDDRCCSVSYRKGQCNLSQKGRAAETCYNDKNWQFTELVDKSCKHR